MLLDAEIVEAVKVSLHCVDDYPRRVFCGRGGNKKKRNEPEKGKIGKRVNKKGKIVIGGGK